MKHLGDITKISGYDAPVVDCVVGGSPCQDLSVAGKRAGLDGERSGLYIEQVRIVKEMREQDERNGRTGVDVRPRYMVWENVPGAFSSNKGEDFRIVLEELAKVKDKDAVIPMPDKWTNHGCILGDGWSIAWRVLDAQFWGVPQRRRRIALVADFGGQSAPEILFVSKSVSGYLEPSESKREATSSDAEGGIGADDIFCIDGDKLNKKERNGGSGIGYRKGNQYTLTAKDVHGVAYSFELGIASREGGHIYEGVSGTLRANAGDNQMATAYGISSYNSNAMKSDNPHSGIYEADTSRTLDGNGGNPSCNQGGIAIVESVPYTLKIRSGCEGGGNVPMVMQQCYSKSRRAKTSTDFETWKESDTANTLNVFDVGDVRTTEAVVYALDRASFNQGKNAQFDFEVSDNGVNSTIVAKGPSAVAYIDTSHADDVVRMDNVVAPLQARDYKGGKLIASVDCRNATECEVNGALQSNSAHSLNGNNVVRTRYIVRRLTPLECERLQGYPDGWTDIGEWVDSNGKKRQTSDAARYKALGNSIALPPWKWVLKRLCACYERDATMASLFDGIGGFPYLWEQLNGKGSCLWASEIEEFPMAVTKVRIGE